MLQQFCKVFRVTAKISHELQVVPKRNLHLAPPFLVEDYTPTAVVAFENGVLEKKVDLALKELEHCLACPRDCGVNRIADKKGACNTGRKAIVSSAFPHFGEESVLQG